MTMTISAGRKLSPRYMGQLTRQDEAHPRVQLEPSRISGNMYLYRVGDLFTVRFNQVKQARQQKAKFEVVASSEA